MSAALPFHLSLLFALTPCHLVGQKMRLLVCVRERERERERDRRQIDRQTSIESVRERRDTGSCM